MVFFSCCCAESISVADQLRSAMVERTLSLGFFESAMLTVARVQGDISVKSCSE
jgi:hypothetical protein